MNELRRSSVKTFLFFPLISLKIVLFSFLLLFVSMFDNTIRFFLFHLHLHLQHNFISLMFNSPFGIVDIGVRVFC